jgi:uncharacterized protein YjiS (DUF1127 family)
VSPSPGSLLRCPDPALVTATATEELMNAAGTIEDAARLAEKLAAFGRAATAPSANWRERRRARRAS